MALRVRIAASLLHFPVNQHVWFIEIKVAESFKDVHPGFVILSWVSSQQPHISKSHFVQC